jgi:putative transposase
MSISDFTFHNWKKKFGCVGISEIRRLIQLEDENSRLKQIVEDLTLDKQMLQYVFKKMSENQSTKGFGTNTKRSI